MAKLRLYEQHSMAKLIALRPGETKLGECLQYISNLNELPESKQEFIIFGIPEDIGVRANYGKPGTSTAWNAFLKNFLNIQDNHFITSEKILLLGEIDCREEMEKASLLEPSDPNYYVKLGELVEEIDQQVSHTVSTILSTGKVPVVIGGGHNNAYGNIKGAAEALKTSLNVLNIDAHTDLRHLEHRHSGNGFSYAHKNGYLKKYAVFGLHQSYTPQFIYDEQNLNKKERANQKAGFDKKTCEEAEKRNMASIPSFRNTKDFKTEESPLKRENPESGTNKNETNRQDKPYTRNHPSSLEQDCSSPDLYFQHWDQLLSGEDHIKAFQKSLAFVNDKKFGLEVDCDVMSGFPSSALSPSGFSLDQVRRLVQLAAGDKSCTYLHLCEAIDNDYFPTGKALSFLVSDFIKNKSSNQEKRII